ncbi:O-antigen ligase family protein, partial [Candidatus Roizmanbacteria bacterium]|nr:O-antigen ligase family protein [Candidatus Roizmanbacteria bacterium]
LLFIFLVFIVLTFSRILYLTVVVIALLILITKKLYRRSIVFLFGFLLLIFVAPKPGGEGVNLGRLFSVQSRLNDYKLALQIWQKNPVFGVGYNRIRYEKIKLNIEEEKDLVTSHSGGSFHSSLLVILVSGGIVGFMGFMGVLYSFAKMSRPIAYFVLFLSLLSLADNIFLHPFVLFLFLSIVLLDSFSLSRRQQ